MLMLRWYNSTGIYIIRYRQSIAFSNIYIGGPLDARELEENGCRADAGHAL